MKSTLLLHLYKPFLTPIDADEIRAEIAAMRPQVHLVMPAPWQWLEVRGLKDADELRVMEMLKCRQVRFDRLETRAKESRARVQVSEVMEVC